MTKKAKVQQLDHFEQYADAQLGRFSKEVKKWLAIRKKAGRKIDPETAEVTWWYGETFDPYGIDPDLPEDCQQIQRNYFARAPGSDVWVSFDDLPEATLKTLWEMHRHRLAAFVVQGGRVKWNI